MQILVIPLSTSNYPIYVSYLKTCIRLGSKVSRDPYIISGYKQDSVIIVSLYNGQLQFDYPDFNTYGASVNKIQMTIFNKRCTINEAVFEEMTKETDIKTISNKYGDSVEKTLFINMLINKEQSAKI